MSYADDNPATIALRPATEHDSLHGGHVLEIGRSHGSYRQVLSTEELRCLADQIRDYLGQPVTAP